MEETLEQLLLEVTMGDEGRALLVGRYGMEKLRDAVEVLQGTDSWDTRSLILATWTSASLVSLLHAKSLSRKNYYETELLKGRVEQEHTRILTKLIPHFESVLIFLDHYFTFLRVSGLWRDDTLSTLLILLLPTGHVGVEEVLYCLSKILVSEYWFGHLDVVTDMARNMSLALLKREWTSTVEGCKKCIETLMRHLNSVKNESPDKGLLVVDTLVDWMHYLVDLIKSGGPSGGEAAVDLTDVLCIRLYLGEASVHRVVAVGSLVSSCCRIFTAAAIQAPFKYFFQNTVLSMINSDALDVVIKGYDIIIGVVDVYNNKDSFSVVKLFTEDEITRLKLPTDRVRSRRLFQRNDFVLMVESINKVVLKSIERFVEDRTLLIRVNTLVSLLVVEGSDSAQGLESVADLAMAVQYSMLEKMRLESSQLGTLAYHAAIASWFHLLARVNTGDLDLLRTYVRGVLDNRADAAPYLLPAATPVYNLPFYIYEVDKSLYFQEERVRSAVSNSWAVLSNHRHLFSNVKVPKSRVLIQKYTSEDRNVIGATSVDQSIQSTYLEQLGDLLTYTEQLETGLSEPFLRFIGLPPYLEDISSSLHTLT